MCWLRPTILPELRSLRFSARRRSETSLGMQSYYRPACVESTGVLFRRLESQLSMAVGLE